MRDKKPKPQPIIVPDDCELSEVRRIIKKAEVVK